ncbi:MAG: hypothetical protein U5L00_05120 [Desulfovermiculus sp.]|nr:hypothetical protein [Desulfovermiculus sp.]
MAYGAADQHPASGRARSFDRVVCSGLGRFSGPRFPYDEALRLARVVGLDVERDIIGTVAEKKSSDVILWDSETRAAKGSLGATDGSRAMLDALHHAAYAGRTKNIAAAAEMLSSPQLGILRPWKNCATWLLGKKSIGRGS